MKIAVAGGTGMVGSHVVDIARTRGHEVVGLSRSTGIDLMTADGLADALVSTDVVIDVTSVETRKGEDSAEFFGTITRNLLAAEVAAGTPHHVALGIVGTDVAREGYYAGKLVQEQLVEGGPVPWSILRATQFHEFAQQIHGAVTVGPFVLVPVMRSETVSAREVAARLVELAESPPVGRATDLGGPSTHRMVDLVRAYARRAGDRRPVVAVPLPGRLGKALRNGSLVTSPDADHGQVSFEQWLESVPSGAGLSRWS